MGNGRFERLAPLSGVLFAVIFAAGFLSSGDTPDADASAETVIDHYGDSGKIFLGVILLMLGGVVLLFFAGTLRRYLAAAGSEWLATVVLGGAAVFAAGLGDFISSQVALVEAADKNQVDVAKALNAIDNSNFGPVVIGLTVVLLATAWHVLTTRSLASWVGWLALVLGIVALAGPLGFIAFLAFPVWVLATSIVMYRSGPRTSSAGLERESLPGVMPST